MHALRMPGTVKHAAPVRLDGWVPVTGVVVGLKSVQRRVERVRWRRIPRLRKTERQMEALQRRDCEGRPSLEKSQRYSCHDFPGCCSLWSLTYLVTEFPWGA